MPDYDVRKVTDRNGNTAFEIVTYKTIKDRIGNTVEVVESVERHTLAALQIIQDKIDACKAIN